MSDADALMTTVLDWFWDIDHIIPGVHHWVSEIILGPIPLSNASNVYELAEHWGRLAEALNDAYEDVQRSAEQILDNWSGDAAANRFAEQWFAYLEGLRQTAESAAQMQRGVQSVGLEVELMKFMAVLNLIMLAVSIYMLIAAAVPSGGGSLLAAPGLVLGTKLAIQAAASKTIGKISSIVIRAVMRNLSRVFGRAGALATKAMPAGVRAAAPRIAAAAGNRVATAATSAMTNNAAGRLARTVAATGISRAVANRMAAQALRGLAGRQMRGTLAGRTTNAVQRELAKEIRQQLRRQWVNRAVQEGADEVITRIAQQQVARSLGREFAGYVGVRVAFGAGFMGGGNLLGQFGQILSGNRTDGVDWGKVGIGTLQGAAFGAGMFGGPLGHAIGGGLAGGGFTLGTEYYQKLTTGEDIDWQAVRHHAAMGAAMGIVFGGQTHLENSNIGGLGMRVGRDVHILPGADGGFNVASTRTTMFGNRENLLLTSDGYVAYQSRGVHVEPGAAPDPVLSRPDVAHAMETGWRNADSAPTAVVAPPDAAPAQGGGRGDGPAAPTRTGGDGGGPRQNTPGGTRGDGAGPSTIERVRVPAGDGPVPHEPGPGATGRPGIDGPVPIPHTEAGVPEPVRAESGTGRADPEVAVPGGERSGPETGAPRTDQVGEGPSPTRAGGDGPPLRADGDAPSVRVDGEGSPPARPDGDGLLPARAGEDSPPVRADADGVPPARADADGPPPARADADGSLPARADADGSLPARADADGSLPARADSDGARPGGDRLGDGERSSAAARERDQVEPVAPGRGETAPGVRLDGDVTASRAEMSARDGDGPTRLEQSARDGDPAIARDGDPATVRDGDQATVRDDDGPPPVPREPLASAGHEIGIDPTPESIAHGTVRMEDHPDFPRVVAELADRGFSLLPSERNPHTVIRNIVDPKTHATIRVEREVRVIEGMRYLDLEHEIGHVNQLLDPVRFPEGPPASEAMRERPGNTPKEVKTAPGLLSHAQDRIVEYHVRLEEYLRLAGRGVDPVVLAQHAEGVADARTAYNKIMDDPYKRADHAFARNRFGDIPALERQIEALRAADPDGPPPPRNPLPDGDDGPPLSKRDLSEPVADEASTGASIRPRDITREDAWANDAYRRFREDDTDVAHIAAHLADAPRPDGSRGFTPAEVQQIKSHLMLESHPIRDYDGLVEMRRFDSDAPTAEAWIRLRDGRYLPEDLVLLEHELVESTYMRQHPDADYRTAHIYANERHNWGDSIPARTGEDLDVHWGRRASDGDSDRLPDGPRGHESGGVSVRVPGDGPPPGDREGQQPRQTGGRDGGPQVPRGVREDPASASGARDLAGGRDVRGVEPPRLREDHAAGRDPEPGSTEAADTGGVIRPRDLGRQFEWAEAAYERFRADPGDVADIAANLAGVPRADGGVAFSAREIGEIKSHLMEDAQPRTRSDGTPFSSRFDADADIAEAWIRLREGRHRAEDLVLLEHELAERAIMRANPEWDYATAHREANRLHNWEQNQPGRTGERYDTSWGNEPHGDPDRVSQDPGRRDSGGVSVRVPRSDGPHAGDRQGDAGRAAGGRDGGQDVRGRALEDFAVRGAGERLAGDGVVRGLEAPRLVDVAGVVPEHPVAAPREVASLLDSALGALVDGRTPDAPNRPHLAAWDAEAQVMRVRYGDGLEVDVRVQVNESVPPGRSVVVRPEMELVGGTWRQNGPAAVVISPHVPADPVARASHVQHALESSFERLHGEVAKQLHQLARHEEIGAAAREDGRLPSSGHESGVDPSPQSIQQGTVRFREHPDFPARERELNALGVTLRPSEVGHPQVEYRRVVDGKTGALIRTEKEMHVIEDMRWMDFEHEFDHVRQMEDPGRFPQEKWGTNAVKETSAGYSKVSNASHVLGPRMAVVEYHVRLMEVERLILRGVDRSIVDAHLRGLDHWATEYHYEVERRPNGKVGRWQQEHFRDIPELQQRVADLRAGLDDPGPMAKPDEPGPMAKPDEPGPVAKRDHAPQNLRALEDPVRPDVPVRDADQVGRHHVTPADPPAPPPLTPETVRQTMTGRNVPEQLPRWAEEHLVTQGETGAPRPRSAEEINATVRDLANRAADLVTPRAEPVDGVRHTASRIDDTGFVPDGRPPGHPDVVVRDLERAAGEVQPRDFADRAVRGVHLDGPTVRVELADGTRQHFAPQVGRGMDALAETTVRAGTPEDPHLVRVNHRVADDQLSRVWVHEITETLAIRHAEQNRPQPHGVVRRAIAAIGRIFGGGDGGAPPQRVDPHIAARMNERVHLQRLYDEARGRPAEQSRLAGEIAGVERYLADRGHQPPRSLFEVPRTGVPDGVIGGRERGPNWRDAEPVRPESEPVRPEPEPVRRAIDPESTQDAHWTDRAWERENRRPSLDEIIPRTDAEAARWGPQIRAELAKLFETREFAGFRVRFHEDGGLVVQADRITITMMVLDRGVSSSTSHTNWVFDRAPDGTLTTKINTSSLQPSLQGRQFTREWHRFLEEWFTYSGVSHVEVHASNRGGYSWARDGYDWLPGSEFRPGEVMKRLAAAVHRVEDDISRVTRWRNGEIDLDVAPLLQRYGAEHPGQLVRLMENERDAGRAIADRVRRHPFGSDGYPTPFEVSQAGRPPGRSGTEALWVGKEAMLGSNWFGVKPISDGVVQHPRIEESAPRQDLFNRDPVRTNEDVLLNGTDVPLTREAVDHVAELMGIDLGDVRVRILTNPEDVRYLDHVGASAFTPAEMGGRAIYLGPAAFADAATLAATVAHEYTHVLQLRAGRDLSTESLRLLEDEAYASEAAALESFRAGFRGWEHVGDGAVPGRGDLRPGQPGRDPGDGPGPRGPDRDGGDVAGRGGRDDGGSAGRGVPRAEESPAEHGHPGDRTDGPVTRGRGSHPDDLTRLIGGRPEEPPFRFDRFYEDATWGARSLDFETRLGVHYFNDATTLQTVRQAVEKLHQVLVDLAVRTLPDSPLRTDVANRVEEVFFRADEQAYKSAGQVGHGVPLRTLLAEGNLRELMTAFYNAAYFNRASPHTLAHALVHLMDTGRLSDGGLPPGLARTELFATQWNLDRGLIRNLGRVEELLPDRFNEHRFARDPFATGAVVARSGHPYRDMLEVVQSQLGRRERTDAEQALLANTAEHYARLGAPLGRFERAFVESINGGPLTPHTRLPWREGSVWHDTGGSRWARGVRRDGLVVLDGVSATTTRMLTAAKLLGLRGVETERFLHGLIGWMLPARDHSLIELLRGASIAGVEPLAVRSIRPSAVELYRNVPGIDMRTVRTSIAPDGLLPHEAAYLERARSPRGFSETQWKVPEIAERLWPPLRDGVVPKDSELVPWLERNGIDPQDPAAVRAFSERFSEAHLQALTVYTRHSHYLINTAITARMAGLPDAGVAMVHSKRITTLLDNYMGKLATGGKALPLPMALREVVHQVPDSGHIKSDAPLRPAAKGWVAATRDLAQATAEHNRAVRAGDRDAALVARAEMKALEARAAEFRKALLDEARPVTRRLFDEVRWHADMVYDALLQLPTRGTPENPVIVYRGDWIQPVHSPIYGSRLNPNGVAMSVLSTSEQLAVAVRFMEENPASDRKVIAVYRLTGVNARDISVFSAFPQDGEVVLPPGSRTRQVHDPELVAQTLAQIPEHLHGTFRVIVLEERPR